MPDNFVTNPGVGGATFASDDIGGVQYPRFKPAIGVDGVAVDVSASNPMPVTGGLTDAELRASAVPVSGPLTDAELRAAEVPVLPSARAADFWPAYGGTTDTGTAELTIDPAGALITRGAVTTDEGTFRVNFANTSLAVSVGTVTVSGRTVTGTAFITGAARDVHLQDYFKLDADAESAWTQIESIDSDTQITLTAAYPGGTSGAASRALIRPVTGAGGSISVASGQCTLTSGTTAGSITRLFRAVDYAPLVARGAFSVSQRIANQSILFGLCEQNTTTDRWFARFRIDGTTSTTVICESGRNPTGAPSAAETQSTTVTLPNAATTAASNEYRVEMLTERAIFYVNGIRLAEHTRSIPAQHDELEVDLRIVNGGTAPASSTTVVADYLTGKNHNKLEIGVFSDSEQIVTQQPDAVPFSYNVAGVIAINTVLLAVDCLRFRSLSIQATSIGTTGVVTPEWSNDGTNWRGATISTEAGAAATTFNAVGLWTTPVLARFFRLRLSTATTAGTTTLFVNAYSQSAGFLPTQPVSGTVTANIGTGSIAAGTNAIGDVGIQYRANATGAASVANLLCPATPAAQSIKATAGRLLTICVSNTAASARWLKVWNTASGGVTLGTTAALFELGIPPNQTVNLAFDGGIGFATAITFAVTGGAGLTNNTAVTLGDVTGFVGFA